MLVASNRFPAFFVSFAHPFLVVFSEVFGFIVSAFCMTLQGPLGWQSIPGLPVGESLLHRDIDFVLNTDDDVEISALSWEATIQKHIEEELYSSALEVSV